MTNWGTVTWKIVIIAICQNHPTKQNTLHAKYLGEKLENRTFIYCC